MFPEMQRILIRARRYGYCKEGRLPVAHFTSEFSRLEFQTFIVTLKSLSAFKESQFQASVSGEETRNHSIIS